MNGNGFPLWIKAIATVGFPIVTAMFLAFLLYLLYPLGLETNAQVQSHNQGFQSYANQLQVQVRLLRNICRNVSTTEFERANCDI